MGRADKASSLGAATSSVSLVRWPSVVMNWSLFLLLASGRWARNNFTWRRQDQMPNLGIKHGIRSFIKATEERTGGSPTIFSMGNWPKGAENSPSGEGNIQPVTANPSKWWLRPQVEGSSSGCTGECWNFHSESRAEMNQTTFSHRWPHGRQVCNGLLSLCNLRVCVWKVLEFVFNFLPVAVCCCN